MRRCFDALYLIILMISAPVWIIRLLRTGKHRTDWPARFGRGPSLPPATGQPTLLLHAVSVGEVNAIRLLVDKLAQLPHPPRIVIATTTDTGMARARDLYSDRYEVVRFPFDFSPAVDRFLSRIRPDVAALVELELWPNFTEWCQRRGIPVCVINGRLSERSYRRYRLIRRLVRPAFARLACAAVQNSAYAARFESLGTPADRIHITGTMKWDTAECADEVPGAEDLAAEMGIDLDRPLVVAGSTAPDEHRLLHDAVPDGVQLLCAPRKPEWFDGAAADLPGCARRSRGDRGSATGRFLLDTIGELRKAYALSDVVVIGRSFGSLHGSDMMEPVALGKPTIVGPAVDDFQETADALLEAGGIIQTDRDRLAQELRGLLDDRERRSRVAARGRTVIRQHQGATEKTIDLLNTLLTSREADSAVRAAATSSSTL